MIVFCWGMRMSFWSRPGRDFKFIRMHQQNNHLSHEIQTQYFFYNRILKFLNVLIFVKFSLDAKIFVKKFPWVLKYNYFTIQGNFLTNIFSLSKMTIHHNNNHFFNVICITVNLF
jgi:hypothetical protein